MAFGNKTKANLYAAGLGMIADGDAQVVSLPGDKYVVKPSAAQVQKLSDLVDAGMSFAKTPTDVSIDFSGVYKPILFKKVLPAAAGLILIGFLAGRYLK